MKRFIFLLLLSLPMMAQSTSVVENALLIQDLKKNAPTISLLEKINQALQKVDDRLGNDPEEPLECATDERISLENIQSGLLHINTSCLNLA